MRASYPSAFFSHNVAYKHSLVFLGLSQLELGEFNESEQVILLTKQSSEKID